jgi:hypothetical protein
MDEVAVVIYTLLRTVGLSALNITSKHLVMFAKYSESTQKLIKRSQVHQTNTVG